MRAEAGIRGMTERYRSGAIVTLAYETWGILEELKAMVRAIPAERFTTSTVPEGLKGMRV